MSFVSPWIPKKVANPINEFITGKKERNQQLPLINKQQQGLQQSLISQLLGQNTNIQQSPLFQQGSSFLQNLLSGSPEATAAFEAPYMRQFQEQIIPALSERFSGGFGIPGASSAKSSSAFQQALGAAGAGLSENLASLRSGLQMQALPQAFNYAQQPISNYAALAGQALRPSLENMFRPSTGGILGGLFGGASQGLGQAGGMAGMAKLLPLLGLL